MTSLTVHFCTVSEKSLIGCRCDLTVLSKAQLCFTTSLISLISSCQELITKPVIIYIIEMGVTSEHSHCCSLKSLPDGTNH